MRQAVWIVVALMTTVMFIVPVAHADTKVPRISKKEVKSMLGNPNVTILDVRKAKEWNLSNQKIKGAVREDAMDTKSWARKYAKGKTIITYCA